MEHGIGEYTPEELKKIRTEKLKKIAKDMWAGKIFTNQQIQHKDDLGLVFMPLLFLRKEDVDYFKKIQVEFVYEYLTEAGSRSINGMPTFFSCRTLSKDESEEMWEYYNEFKKVAEKF